jgi:N-acetyl-anhydromuramyl-L-alanine amidase AmpD
MKVVTRNSPNQSARIHGNNAVRLIVCHTPEGSYASAIATCMNPRADVSYHRLYNKAGTEATQLVPWERKAWHAGPINSLSDGLSIEGHARHFDLADPGVKEFAKGTAERLIARKLKPQWTTDPARGGFCRHGDLQSDRSDPTPDLAEWRRFVAMVVTAHRNLLGDPDRLPGPSPKPQWFWDAADAWLAGQRQGLPGPRPKPDWFWEAVEEWVRQH